MFPLLSRKYNIGTWTFIKRRQWNLFHEMIFNTSRGICTNWWLTDDQTSNSRDRLYRHYGESFIESLRLKLLWMRLCNDFSQVRLALFISNILFMIIKDCKSNFRWSSVIEVVLNFSYFQSDIYRPRLRDISRETSTGLHYSHVMSPLNAQTTPYAAVNNIGQSCCSVSRRLSELLNHSVCANRRT